MAPRSPLLHRSPLINMDHPFVRVLKRVLLAVFGVPMVVALAMSAVDSYRRRGKKPKPFPTRTAQEIAVGSGTVTTYTFGQDLYDDMLAAIEGAQHQILLETYIWKADAVGQQFKRALIDAADRGVEVRIIYDAFANLVVRPPFKHFPPQVKVLAYPVYAAGWRFFDLRRYGRDHRKILVVDDKVAFVGGYNIGIGVRDRVARHPRPDHRAGGRRPRPRVRGLLEPAPRQAPPAPLRPQRAADADGGLLDAGSRRSGCIATSRGCGCSRSARCTSRRSTAPSATSG